LPKLLLVLVLLLQPEPLGGDESGLLITPAATSASSADIVGDRPGGEGAVDDDVDDDGVDVNVVAGRWGGIVLESLC